MALHVQLVTSTMFYASAFLCCIVTIISLLIAKAIVHHKCLLFVQTSATYEPEKASDITCDFTLYFTIFPLVFGLVMTLYHGYAFIVSKRDEHVARTMWVMPWVLLDSLVIVFGFISACMYSIGFSQTCSNIRKGLPMNKGKSCKENFSTMDWNKDDTQSSKPYSLMAVVEASAWLNVLLWIGALSLMLVRVFRNRRARAATSVFNDLSTSDKRKITEPPSTP
ncbi:uncharacterized protein LOC143252066 [Tachypleus tridentatus]|uniref:uncharacterized protein LOC143252066 n=1 Tax=Tachypleus tridentatus TaxID=6853 RepID=UPI003FD2113A